MKALSNLQLMRIKNYHPPLLSDNEYILKEQAEQLLGHIEHLETHLRKRFFLVGELQSLVDNWVEEAMQPARRRIMAILKAEGEIK